MKLAVIGGGSTYTPELIDGFARLRDELPLSEIMLIDPDERRLGLVAGMAARMLARADCATGGMIGKTARRTACRTPTT